MEDGDNAYYYYIRAEMEKRESRTDQAVEYMQKAVAVRPESVFLKKELVYLYLQNDQTEKALATTEAILADNPDDIGTLIIAATIKKQAGQDEEAAALFQKILTINPKQEKIYHLLGEYYLEKNDLEKAAAVYRQMTETFPDVWEAFFFLGKIQAQQGEYGSAEKNFRRCLELEKTLISPRFELIRLYKNLLIETTEVTIQPGDTLYSLCKRYYGKYNQTLAQKINEANPKIKNMDSLKVGQKLTFPVASDTCDRACREKIINLYKSILDDHPDNYRAAMELALYYHSIGEAQKGDAILIDLAGKSEPADQYMIQLISQFYISRKRIDDAKTVLTGMLRGAPDNSGLHYLLGVVYDKQEKDADALEHFSRVQADSPFYTTTLIQMAFLYEQKGQPDKAEALFDLLLEREPDNVDLILYAGSFLERQKKYEEAATLFKQGLEKEPENVDLLFRLGVVYDKTGQKEAVIQQMKTIIKIAPDDANALNYLGYTYADMGINLDEAQALVEKALKLDPDNGYITDSLGWVFYQKGEMDKAIELLSRAVELTPEDSILLEHLGDAYLKNGQTRKAMDAYQKSLQFADDDEDNERIKKKIDNISRTDNTP